MKFVLLSILAFGCAQTDDAGEEAALLSVSPEALNANTKEFDGKSVLVRGFVRYGFDGWHTACTVSPPNANLEETEAVLLADPACVEKGKRREYREGVAVVYGTFVDNDGEIFAGGGIYSGQIKVTRVEWEDL